MWQKREAARQMSQKGSSETFGGSEVLNLGFGDERKGQQAKDFRRPLEVENDYQSIAHKEPVSSALQ